MYIVFYVQECVCVCCQTNLMLKQNPVNEQSSNVLLFPMKLQEERTYLNHPSTDSLEVTTIGGLAALTALTLFSMDFLTRVKLFQRESNSFL